MRALVVAMILLGAVASRARAEPKIPSLLPRAVPAAASPFGPRYLIERTEITGNVKTATWVIQREVLIHAGDVLGADDPRVELSRFRVLALGFFSDVRLTLRRGAARGQAVLVVDVTERGTIILNSIFFGGSNAVPFYGGMDASENNLGGRGVAVGAAYLLATQANYVGGRPQQAYRLRLAVGRLAGTAVSLSTTLLYSDADEPYRTAGAPGDGRPLNFTGVHYRRIGGAISFGMELGASFRISVDYRFEGMQTDIPASLVYYRPDGRTQPVNVGLRPNLSFESTVSLQLERDTRSDPVLPLSGSRFTVSNDFSTRAIGSSYEYYKLTTSFQGWVRLPWGHALSLLVLAGVIIGEAPIFDRFYIGDLNPLVQPRALGLTLSTLPSRNLLGAGISDVRYGVLAGRLGVEYLYPVFRGGEFFYGGHLFVGLGVLALVPAEGLRDREVGDLYKTLPIDLYFDAGLRLDTYLGVFNFSIANFVGRMPF